MTSVLYIIGVIALIACFILGVISGGILVGIIIVIGGIPVAIIFFALAKILDNQEKIMLMLNSESTQKKKLIPQKQCEKCEKMHDGDATSCPHCGHKSGNKLSRHG